MLANYENIIEDFKNKNKGSGVSIEYYTASSGSVYITYRYGEISHTRRISDHFSKADCKTLIIKKSTKNSTIIRFLEKGLDTIKQAHFNKEMGEI